MFNITNITEHVNTKIIFANINKVFRIDIHWIFLGNIVW